MNSAHIAADHMISGDMLPKKTPKRWSGRNSVQNMEEWNVVSNHPNKLFIRRQSCASNAILQFHIFVTHWFYGSMDPGVVSNSGSVFSKVRVRLNITIGTLVIKIIVPFITFKLM